ncbi:hypothetical protein [Pseudorhodoplanes sp.]|uniref:hypothetical protein n=1 Tax=Pseudorhodoplanes sp. TaxID=1934341 RepID=UPI003D0DF33B
MTTLKKIEPEADGVLKDGQTIHFRPMMMDTNGTAVSVHQHSAVLTDEQRKAAEARIKAHDAKLSNAWRNPPAQHIPQDLSKTPPEVVKPVAFGDGKPVNLDQMQATNERRYAARISEMWRNPTN